MAKKLAAEKQKVLEGITDISRDVYTSILKMHSPHIEMPLRALANVKYNPKQGDRATENIKQFGHRKIKGSTFFPQGRTLVK